MERLTIKNSDGTYSQPTHTTFEKMFYKLAEFEDFMEIFGFEDLEDLERYISQSIKASLIINKKRQETKVLEKALVLACDKIADLLDPCGEPENAWFYDFDGGVVERKGFEDCYKSQAEKEVNDAI